MKYAPGSKGHVVAFGSEGNTFTFDLDETGGVINLRPTDDQAPFESPPAADAPPTLREEIEAVTSHAQANELAKRLSVEGFEEKSPKVADKKAALLAKAVETEVAAVEA